MRMNPLALLATCFVALGAGSLIGCTPAESQLQGDVVSWTIPTARTDGTALPSSQYKETRIQWGTSPSGPFNVGSTIVAGTATTVTVPRTTYGTRCYVAVAVDTNGLESSPSNTACKTLIAPPNAPVLTVQ
jgi:hypothetical protein